MVVFGSFIVALDLRLFVTNRLGFDGLRDLDWLGTLDDIDTFLFCLGLNWLRLNNVVLALVFALFILNNFW